MLESSIAQLDTAELKSCCANLYASDWATLLLGDTFHPGGLALTGRLGTLLDLQPGHHVLDVASGPGHSALHLAQTFGCQVTGLDYSAEMVARAGEAAAEAGLGHLVTFEQGDAERLPFDDASFDAIICECAFCTFPDKTTAAAELARVLRPNGRVGLSDLTRSGPLPPELDGLLAWIACIADARPPAEYVAYLAGAGLAVEMVEPHNEALSEIVSDVRGKLLGAELLVRLKKIDLPGADLAEARQVARAAAESVHDGTLGYAVFVGRKGE